MYSDGEALGGVIAAIPDAEIASQKLVCARLFMAIDITSFTRIAL